MPAEMIDVPNRLADRVVGIGDGLTLEQMLDRAEEILARTVRQWHAGALQNVTFMIGHWSGRGLTGNDLATTATCFAAVARDIKESALELGYPDIAVAAGGLRSVLLRIDADVENGDDGSLRGQSEGVTIALAHLRTKIVEARQVPADATNLLATAA